MYSPISPIRSCVVCMAATVLSFMAPSGAQSQERASLSGREVAIYNLAGRVRVEPGTGSDITVEVTRGGRDGAKLKVATGQIRGRDAFRVLYPVDDDIVYAGDRDGRQGSTANFRIDDDGTWGGDRDGMRGRRVRVKTSGSGTEAWADLVIRVPAGRNVAVYLGLGELAASGVDADLRLDVSAARVTTNETRGRLDIDAGSGGVEVRNATGGALTVDNGSGGLSLTDVKSETCTIDTGSGGVEGSGVQCGTLSIDIGSGSVRLGGIASADVTVDAGSGGVNLTFNSSPKRLSVESGSGGVTIALPSSLDANVDIDTGSGAITSDFPVRVTRVDRNQLRGTIGDGSGRIRIESGSGSVRLRKATD